MKRHLRGVAVALALLPTLTFAQSLAQPAPASAAASAPGHAFALKGYVRPEAPAWSPDKEWLAANRALREDGGMDMGDMQMPSIEAPKTTASTPAAPHAGHQMKPNGH